MTDSYESFKKDYLRVSGIDLSSYKESQMKRRIDNFITKSGARSYRDFISLIKRDKKTYDDFVTHLTINVSEFYRNPSQWETLKTKIFPELIQRFGKKITIWSAACSTGDEPYSLAMVMSELLAPHQFEILATDLDREVLAKAKRGVYTEKSVRGLPKEYREKYMVQDEPGFVRVSDQLKSRITFKQMDLLKDTYPRRVHLLVCRNVLIYFTDTTKEGIYRKFADSLLQGGILFVGSTEQIIGAKKFGFQGVQSFFYQKE